MTVKTPAPPSPIESRWPVVTAVLVVMALLMFLPGTIRLLPTWVAGIVGIVVLIPIVAVGFSSARERWVRIERWSILVYFVYALNAIVANLTNLVYAMVFRSSEISGSQLIMSSVAVWAAMILMYSLLYWQLDRGGPESRLAGTGSRPDWLFPQGGAPAEDVPPDWRPTYVDYLFLSYTTATAFSPTDTLPLSPRAKLLMMLESATSLMTIIVIAARAINILG